MNLSGNLFLNFHAHEQRPTPYELIIQSKFLQDYLDPNKPDTILYTSGLHQWHAEQLSSEQIRECLEKRIKLKQIIVIGETGLDKLKSPDLKIQFRSI